MQTRQKSSLATCVVLMLALAASVHAQPVPADAVMRVTLLGTGSPPPTLRELAAATRKSDDGLLVMGEDLMSFSVGPSGVETSKRP
jgi:hypothetical protein